MKGISLSINTIVVMVLGIVVLSTLVAILVRQPENVNKAEKMSKLAECCSKWVNENYNPTSVENIKCGEYSFKEVIMSWDVDPSDINAVKKLCAVK